MESSHKLPATFEFTLHKGVSMKLTGLLLASFLAFSTVATADIGIRPPAKGQPGGKTGIGRFEQKQRAKRIVDGAAKVSGLNEAMQDEQPNDLKNLKAALVKGFLADADAKDGITQIANTELSTDPQEREEEQFNMQMMLTLLAGQYGYQEQDN